MRSGTRRAPHAESHLHPTPTLERLRQMLKREIVNHHHRIARRERRGGVLNVQNIDRSPSQLRRQRQRNSNERSMRQRFPDRNVGPTMCVAIDSFLLRYIKGVAILRIHFRKRFDEMAGVRFIPAQACSDRVCVKPDMQRQLASSESTDYTDSIKQSV